MRNQVAMEHIRLALRESRVEGLSKLSAAHFVFNGYSPIVFRAPVFANQRTLAKTDA
ncbi:MAG: hypothetical protein ABI557_10330 [Aureliella sp.]